MADGSICIAEASRQRNREANARYRKRNGFTPLGESNCVICGADFKKAAHNQKACPDCKGELARRSKNASTRRCNARKAKPLHCKLCGKRVQRRSSRHKVCDRCQPEWRRQRDIAWKRANPDKVQETRLRCRAKQMKSARYKLTHNMSCMIRVSILSKGGRSWQALVDYTLEQLMAHLERQFTKGMSWENYGAWHIDHIRPVRSFDFELPDDPEFRECWALTNLRPLWAKENRKKSGRLVLLL